MNEPVKRPSNRTSSRKVSDLQPGDRVMLIGIEVAVVVSNVPVTDREPLRYVDRGNQGARINGRQQDPVWVHQVMLQWEREHLASAGPNVLRLPGDRHISLRDSN